MSIIGDLDRMYAVGTKREFGNARRYYPALRQLLVDTVDALADEITWAYPDQPRKRTAENDAVLARLRKALGMDERGVG